MGTRRFCSQCGAPLPSPWDACRACASGGSPTEDVPTGLASAPSHATPHSPPRTPPYPALHGAAYTPAAGPPAPSRRPSTRRATLLGLAVAAVLVLAVGAGGLAMSLARDSTSTEAGSTATGTGAKDGGAAEPGGEAAAEMTRRSSAGADGPVRCWTGRPAAGADECPEGPDDSPTAFAWVFPAVELDACTSVQQPRRLIRSCEVGDLRIALSRWENVGAARTYYETDMTSPPVPEEGGRLLWRGFSTTEMTYKSAVMYADHPWSMTVYGPTREATDAGHLRYRMRPARTLRAAAD
ncbi:hypothetical protein GCM10009737_09690 [Nocardioides lentus]|uniref:Zinc ribbon domain-containing protein n=1 Tax=Nocardioides lentus TaxID=338077 RepID=A0ABN2P256_9ACTN